MALEAIRAELARVAASLGAPADVAIELETRATARTATCPPTSR